MVMNFHFLGDKKMTDIQDINKNFVTFFKLLINRPILKLLSTLTRPKLLKSLIVI